MLAPGQLDGRTSSRMHFQLGLLKNMIPCPCYSVLSQHKHIFGCNTHREAAGYHTVFSKHLRVAFVYNCYVCKSNRLQHALTRCCHVPAIVRVSKFRNGKPASSPRGAHREPRCKRAWPCPPCCGKHDGVREN